MAISIENRGRLKIAVQSAEFSRASLIMPPSICRARLAITKMVGLDENEIAVKKSLGVVFQNSVLDKDLTVKDNLESRAALYGIFGEKFKKRLDELSALLDFKDLLPRTLGKLSGGQRRRIDVARALLHKPEILILDEPTTGLDPKTRSLLWQVIENLRKTENMTVFLTTHYMEEAADADYVVILDKG